MHHLLLRVADAVLHPSDQARLTGTVDDPEELASSDARFTRLKIALPIEPAPARTARGPVERQCGTYSPSTTTAQLRRASSSVSGA